mmetsp:Transcript_33261/g.99076  ORF Transcript_33261/g.99076 Transcript_33261/m.99076 type:complete len:218 (-) Transcript_33261:49-702(-)
MVANAYKQRSIGALSAAGLPCVACPCSVAALSAPPASRRAVHWRCAPAAWQGARVRLLPPGRAPHGPRCLGGRRTHARWAGSPRRARCRRSSRAGSRRHACSAARPPRAQSARRCALAAQSSRPRAPGRRPRATASSSSCRARRRRARPLPAVRPPACHSQSASSPAPPAAARTLRRRRAPLPASVRCAQRPTPGRGWRAPRAARRHILCGRRPPPP